MRDPTVVLGGRQLLERSRFSAAASGLYDPATQTALARWIGANDTPRTVYHLHNWHKVLSPSAFVALRPVAARLVMSAHDFFLACPNGAYFHYPRQHECDLAPNGAACIATACDRRHYAHKLWRVARHGLRHRLFDLTHPRRKSSRYTKRWCRSWRAGRSHRIVSVCCATR
jgi:hypothetical protein